MTSAVFLAFSFALLAGLATCIGSVLVLFVHKTNLRLLAFALAFSAGAMVYVSFAEILPKSRLTLAGMMQADAAYALSVAAFLAGIVLFMLIDYFIPDPVNPHHMDDLDVHAAPRVQAHSLPQVKLMRLGWLAMLALTAHNIPEGMVTFFATLNNTGMGLMIALAIAIHNIPEGVSIAVPVYYATGSRRKAFALTLLSALAEPLGAALGYAVLHPFMNTPAIGVLFGVLAGVMVALSLDELLPMARRYSQGHETLFGMALGMGVMAISLVLFSLFM